MNIMNIFSDYFADVLQAYIQIKALWFIYSKQCIYSIYIYAYIQYIDNIYIVLYWIYYKYIQLTIYYLSAINILFFVPNKKYLSLYLIKVSCKIIIMFYFPKYIANYIHFGNIWNEAFSNWFVQISAGLWEFAHLLPPIPFLFQQNTGHNLKSHAIT